MDRKTFSQDEKLQIIKEVSEGDRTTVLEKYGVYPGTYYYWKKKLETRTEAEFINKVTPAQLKRIKDLERENAELKQLLGEMALSKRMEDKLAKKKISLK
jgi:putative transposase